MKLVRAEDLDFAELLRPGDRIVVAQALGEPLALTRRLMQSAAVPEGCRVFLGPVYSDTFSAGAPDGLAFEGYGAIGKAAVLARQGRLDVLPAHYSAMSRAFADGSLRADCVLIQVAPAAEGAGWFAGMGTDYALDAARHARLVIAQINPQIPGTPGSLLPPDIRIDVAVETSEPPLAFASPATGPAEHAIGACVAAIVPEGAVLQFGVGAVPEAVLPHLAGHRDLGIHSGVALDGMVELVERGAITNARKEIDAGVSVAGLLVGSKRLLDFAGNNGPFRLAPASHTHGLGTLARLSRFCAINSAVEVDLTGQVNAETAAGRYVGAVGGQVDFVRGANVSSGGRAIVALPSTAAAGRISRIVAGVATVTCPRSDVDAIVTEWGVAELRGRTLRQRARAMIAIAAPQFREALEHDWQARERGNG